MIRVTVKCVGVVPSLLSYVKEVKLASGLGLKEAKEFCDKTIYDKTKYHELYINCSASEFRAKISQNLNTNIVVGSTERDRQIKLLSIGLGEDSDIIDLIAEQMSFELDHQIKNRKDEPLHNILYEYLSGILYNMNSDQISKLFKEKVIENG